MFDLTGKYAFVTGGSRGIGAATARALASRGAHVVIGYLSGEAAATAVAEEITAQGGAAETARIDAGSFEDSERVVQELGKRLPRLDILVLSAGIALDGLMLRLREEDLDKTLAVNLVGAIAAAKAALRVMMKNRHGRVIFLSGRPETPARRRTPPPKRACSASPRVSPASTRRAGSPSTP
jgi:3-oxoacyl-[acyl-carrier protein] reductase